MSPVFPRHVQIYQYEARWEGETCFFRDRVRTSSRLNDALSRPRYAILSYPVRVADPWQRGSCCRVVGRQVQSVLTATRRRRDCFPAWGPGGDTLRSVVATNTVVHTSPLREGCLRTPGLDNGNLAVMGFRIFQYVVGRRR